VSLMAEKGKSESVAWYLEGYLGDQKTLRRIRVEPLPFRVGRAVELPLSINSANMSRVHAELIVEDGKLFVRDLGSTNGTFVNQKRITEPTPVSEGEIVHFGTSEFRVGCEEVTGPDMFIETLSFEGSLPAQFITGAREFLEMLEAKAVMPYYQPLVRLEDKSVVAYEVLGRGARQDLASLPSELFAIAATVNMETRLSELFREKGVEKGRDLPGQPPLFMNIHPVEMRRPELLVGTLQDLREQNINVPMTLEVHEALFTSVDAMRELRAALDDLRISLAYDDFGAGQARLVELADVPPDFLKFDMSLIQAIDKAPRARRQMVEMLVKYATDIGAACIAEGIETEPELRACQEIGFHIGQGFLLGRPMPPDLLHVNTPVT
jgi:EAL domain-containing protein (putative c-di-GMP-specific phosphodiesterase class I)